MFWKFNLTLILCSTGGSGAVVEKMSDENDAEKTKAPWNTLQFRTCRVPCPVHDCA